MLSDLNECFTEQLQTIRVDMQFFANCLKGQLLDTNKASSWVSFLAQLSITFLWGLGTAPTISPSLQAENLGKEEIR